MSMIKIMAMFVALATSVMFSSGVMAQQSSYPGTSSSAPGASNPAPANKSMTEPNAAPAKMEKFSGVLESVDQSGRSFVVQKGKEKMTFYWDDNTKFMGHGQKTFAATDLKKGEHLTVAYKEEGGKATASRIDVSTKTAKVFHKKSQSKTY